MHYHTSEPKKTSMTAVHAALPYKESVTNARLPFPFSLDCFVLTQRRLQLQCIFFFLDALLAILLTSHNELQLKKRTQATTKSYDSLSRWNSPLLYPWHLRVSNFCCRTSVVMQLWIRLWKMIRNEWNSSECDFWPREQHLCVRVRASFA